MCEIIWLFLFIELYFDKKIFNKKIFNYINVNIVISALAIIYLVVVIIVENSFPNGYYKVFFELLCSVIICLIWKMKILTSLSIVGIYSLITLITKEIILSIIGFLGEEMTRRISMPYTFERILYILISLSMCYLISLLIYQTLKGRLSDNYVMKYNSVLYIISYIGILYFAIQITKTFFGPIDVYKGFVIALICAGIMIPYFIIKEKDLANQLKIVEERNELLIKNYDEVSEYYLANAKINHDMKHHLNIVSSLIAEGSYVEAKDYIVEIKDISEKYSKKTYTGVNIVDVVLSDKENRAKNRGLEFKINAHFLPQDIGIDKKDFCAVLANILDNALEAAEKYINIRIEIHKRMLFIQVENDCNIMPEKKNGFYETTKKDKYLHGWGLKSVMSIVEKYCGIVKTEVEDKKFIVNIIINF